MNWRTTVRTAVRIFAGLTLTMGLVATSIAPVDAAGPLTQRCTNGTEGFSVSYPSDWYTNEAGSTFGSPVDTCTLFAPFDDIEILPEAVNVPVLLKVEAGPLPDGTPTTIDGRPGVIVEAPDLGGHAAYIYYARLSDDTRFAAFAFDNGTAPFDESRAVLDGMVATVDFDGEDPSQAELEPVVLELTLSGKVDTGDTFGIYRQCTDSLVCRFIHDQDVVCSGDEFQQELYSLQECAARTYRLSRALPAGAVLEYGIVRWTGTLEGDLAQYMLRDSVTIPEGGITLRLGYDYALGSPARPQTLPDTAVPRDDEVIVIGLMLIAASVLLWRGRGATLVGRI
jgi:hypothetical protein